MTILPVTAPVDEARDARLRAGRWVGGAIAIFVVWVAVIAVWRWRWGSREQRAWAAAVQSYRVRGIAVDPVAYAWPARPPDDQNGVFVLAQASFHPRFWLDENAPVPSWSMGYSAPDETAEALLRGALRRARGRPHVWWPPLALAVHRWSPYQPASSRAEALRWELQPYLDAVLGSVLRRALHPPAEVVDEAIDLLWLSRVVRKWPGPEGLEMGDVIERDALVLLDGLMTIPQEAFSAKWQSTWKEAPMRLAASRATAWLLDDTTWRQEMAQRLRGEAAQVASWRSGSAQVAYFHSVSSAWPDPVEQWFAGVAERFLRPSQDGELTERWRELMSSAAAMQKRNWLMASNSFERARGGPGVETGILCVDRRVEWIPFVGVSGPTVVAQQFRLATLRRLVAVKIACALYAADHGARVPASLAELVPQYLAQVPDDPYAQVAPLQYRANGAETFIYSVDRNGRDDAGAGGYVPVEAHHLAGSDAGGDDLPCFLHHEARTWIALNGQTMTN